ncbi:serine hydrolase domain-containing protein [Saccharothrix australiensis]|uniref:D-alanyl-D-alanine carboxypeptidase n=1 Tax=Saccharothrix australiensis TaxID=2072 RepID=A0A495W2I3_9PSEU|nr:serine hydrolase domain-containing protein [Saccharothrix australiensis]RKT55350.1 D-alanyl-D-alanine carboxypeptidase [Saccharothrix australiensis]
MAEFQSPGRPKVRAAIDSVVPELGVPSIMVQIRDEDGTWFGSAGVADTVTGAPRVPGEHLHSGSISKAFTAATLLQLEAEGRLSIDDTVDRWLPGAMAENGYDGTQVTIRHLLSNTSGLFATGMALEFQRRYLTRSAFDEHRFDVYQPADVLAIALSEPPVGRPGETFWYSNGGFAFAAAIIEEVTGNSLESEVHRTVVRPLGLKHTFMRHREETGYHGRHPRSYSKLYLKEGTRVEDVTPETWTTLMEDPSLPPMDTTDVNTSGGWGAANVVATPDELITFYTAMVTGGLLPADQHRAMWDTVDTAGTYWLANARYGLGVYQLTLSDGQVLRGGGGASYGTYTFTMGTPDGKRMMLVHTNNDWAAFPAIDRIIEAEFGAGGLRLEM